MENLLIVTTDKNIIYIIANLIATTNFYNNYYYSLWQKNNIYLLYINQTTSIRGTIANLVSELKQIKRIILTSYTKPRKSVIENYDLIFKNYD